MIGENLVWRKFAQSGSGTPEVWNNEHATMVKLFTPDVKCKGNVRSTGLRIFFRITCHVLCRSGKSAVGLGRKGDNLQCSAAFVSGQIRRLFQDQVSVGSTDAERADTGAQRTILRYPRPVLGI